MSAPSNRFIVLLGAFCCLGIGRPGTTGQARWQAAAADVGLGQAGADAPPPGSSSWAAMAVEAGGGQTTLVRCQAASIVTGDGNACRDVVVTNPNLPSTGSSISVTVTFANGSVKSEVLGPGDQRSFHCNIVSITAHETVAPRSTVTWTW